MPASLIRSNFLLNERWAPLEVYGTRAPLRGKLLGQHKRLENDQSKMPQWIRMNPIQENSQLNGHLKPKLSPTHSKGKFTSKDTKHCDRGVLWIESCKCLCVIKLSTHDWASPITACPPRHSKWFTVHQYCIPLAWVSLLPVQGRSCCLTAWPIGCYRFSSMSTPSIALEIFGYPIMYGTTGFEAYDWPLHS